MPYEKSNKEIQEAAFKLRSGNSSTLPFKEMGSSPSKFDFSSMMSSGGGKGGGNIAGDMAKGAGESKEADHGQPPKIQGALI